MASGTGRRRRRGPARLLAAILLLWAISSCAGQRPLIPSSAKRRDIYIAGLFPYATHVPESIVGRGVMPSVKLAVEHINENPNILRNYRLHMWWNDTQESLKLMQNNSTVLREINSNGSEIVHRRSNSFIIENINIKEILEGTFEGRHILRLQEINKRLTPSGRRRLVHLIISKILCDCERDLTDKDFKILSTKIVELFPSECSAIYYSPHVLKKDSPTGNSKPVKGKLVNKYFTLRRIPKSIYQSEKVLIENSSTTDITITDEIESSIEWLNNNEEPWEDTEKYWRITYEYRHLKIQNTCNKKISFIYEEWPILKAPKGYTLIELDFKVDKSTINENAIAGFSEIFKKIEKVRPLKKDDYFEMLYDLLAAEKIKDDEKTLVELTVLCYMIPSSARIPLGKRKFWKPSCTESLDGIIAHLKCNAAVGVKAFFDMMHSGPHKVMLFGAACTQVTDPIAKASKHWRLTQLSYADTHPMFSSDSFPNFFRIVPSENAFNAPRFALLNQFNWTRVGTIYQNEPRYALAHNRLVSDLDQNDVEVVESQSFATEVTTALEKLKGKDVRIILGNFNEVWARKIFCEAHRLKMYGRKYQWVIMGMYTAEWWLRSDIVCAPLELQEALHGTILTDLLPLSTEQQITVSGITPDEYLVEYDARRGTAYSRFHGYTYDGIWAVALAVQQVAHRIRHYRRNETVADFRYRDALWERLFLEALKNTSFEGVTGPVRFYDNERKAYILLKQFQSGSEVKVGEFDAITGTLDLTRGQPLVWRGKSPPKDRTLHIIEHSTVNITIYAVLASAASLGIIMAVVFLAINIKYRNQRYIKMSSPHLNNLIIIGCMLTYSSVIFLGLDSQLSSVTAFPYICTARAWLLMAGFSLAFGSMFSKTWRVHSIFTDVKLNKKVIKDYQLFMVVGVLLFIDFAIMTTWQVADPFYRETKQMEPYPHPSSEDIIIMPENEYCQSNRMTVYLGSIYAYKGLLMIFGAFLAWETRHVSIPALNDSKYVGMSVYNVVIMCVTGAAISFVLADKQDAMFIMLAVFIIFCSTATLCLVFVPKLIELRRNPQGQIEKRFRPTLRPMSKTRRDSTASEMEERLKDMTTTNQTFRKLLHEKESELQMYLRRLGDDGIADTQAAVDRLSVPRHENTIKREGPSVTTETTDISMSMCSLNSTTNVSQIEGDYVNVSSLEQQISKKKTSFSKTIVSSDNERAPVTTYTGGALPSALKNSGEGGNLRRRTRTSTEGVTKSTLETSTTRFADDRATHVEYIEESHSNEESSETHRESKESKRLRLPTPPPPKNVSFGELHEQNYLEQSILPPPVQFIPKHRHTGFGSSTVPHQSSLKRRSSVKNSDMMNLHHELFEKRRTSVPANSISYISTENVARAEESLGSFDKAYVIGECGHKRAFSSTGYRCEKHGGRGHSHVMLNGSSEAPASRRHKVHCDSYNASSPSVPTVVNASYSDTEKYEEAVSNIIQRSVSERSRDKCAAGKSGPARHSHPVSECPHRAAARRSRECHRHVAVESKLRQQANRLEYVQSTPDVATIHNSKFGSGNPRIAPGNNGTAVGAGADVSKMYSAVSDGELLDVAILPIFQKLLTERHKSVSSRYGANVRSCPNISIKCDIVEYL